MTFEEQKLRHEACVVECRDSLSSTLKDEVYHAIT